MKGNLTVYRPDDEVTDYVQTPTRRRSGAVSEGPSCCCRLRGAIPVASEDTDGVGAIPVGARPRNLG
jgi:hypothetical protein